MPGFFFPDKVSINVIGNVNDETNFPNEFLLTDRQFSNLCKGLANNSQNHKYHKPFNLVDFLVNLFDL